jgi:rhodanese-related sulfurtransferase
MPSILNEITYFQFDNLIRNRIPFVILNLGVDIKNFYSAAVYQSHLEKLNIPTSKEKALEELTQRNLQKHEAVLVLCPDGKVSAEVVDFLEAAGFTNVFFAKSGFDNLRADATH